MAAQLRREGAVPLRLRAKKSTRWSKLIAWKWSIPSTEYGVPVYNSSKETAAYFFRNAGAYPVALVVTNSWGCKDTVIKTIKVDPDFHVYVPNAFTPGGDGKNDVFRPIAIGIKQIDYFRVYNRWGVLVYSSAKNANMRTIGWDGRYKGKPQDSAVFVWMAGGVDYLNNKIAKKGTVTLLR